MATASILSTPTYKKYTTSFLNQLQAEWNEFMLDISHSTPNENEIVNNNLLASPKKSNTKEAFLESLYKFSHASGGNILIPVPLHTLRKIFSPTKCNVDDVFKNEFFNELKETLNLTNAACQKLQKLLLSDDSHEVSDFPSPSLPKNFRKSAPPRLFFRTKSKQKCAKNDFLRIVNCFHNDKDKHLLKKVDTDLNLGVDNLNKKLNEDKTTNENKGCPISDISKNNRDERKKQNEFGPEQITKTNGQNLQENLNLKNVNLNISKKIEEDKRYSRIYDVHISGSSDSSSLFYTFKPTKRVEKPTIVFTYFSQKELTKMYHIVKKLGFFKIENNVSSRTTHLICGSSNKTINLCKAVARGCWILDKQWIHSSDEENRWLFEERFEKSDLFSSVKENRLKRQKNGLSYKCDIFVDCGSIHVSKNCTTPSVEDLKELILLCGGRLQHTPELASYIVGCVPKRKYVKETWILTSVLQGRVADVKKYMKNN